MDSGATELFSMRTCPVCIEVYFQPVLQALRVRAIFFKPKSKDHKVTGSNPVLVSMLFLSTSQSLGSSARNLRRLSCGAM